MNANFSRTRSIVGFSAIIVVWVTSAITVPLIKTLKSEFSSEELLIIRSLFGASVALIALRGNMRADRMTIAAGTVVSLSSIAFYRAVQIWNVNPCMVIMAALPVINVVIAIYEGRKVSALVIWSMLGIIVGVAIALEPWRQSMNSAAICYMVVCNILGGIGFELWARAPKTTSASAKCFWMGISLIVISLIIMLSTGQSFGAEKYFSVRIILTVLFFGMAGGVLYIYATIIPFGRIKTETASVLLQGTTPAAIIGTYFIRGESLSVLQWSGVIVAVVCTAILSVWTARKQL